MKNKCLLTYLLVFILCSCDTPSDIKGDWKSFVATKDNIVSVSNVSMVFTINLKNNDLLYIF